jgi:hypothetical protein
VAFFFFFVHFLADRAGRKDPKFWGCEKRIVFFLGSVHPQKKSSFSCPPFEGRARKGPCGPSSLCAGTRASSTVLRRTQSTPGLVRGAPCTRASRTENSVKTHWSLLEPPA